MITTDDYDLRLTIIMVIYPMDWQGGKRSFELLILEGSIAVVYIVSVFNSAIANNMSLPQEAEPAGFLRRNGTLSSGGGRPCQRPPGE